MIYFRKANAADIDAVANIYEAIHTEEESGRCVIGWQRGIYPTRSTAEKAIEAGELFVCARHGRIMATAKINRTQEEAYRLVDWQIKANDDEVLVIHTLCVDPSCAGLGIGKTFVAFYEQMARDMNIRALRMDTNERNVRARKLYASLGYRESGVIPTVFNGIEGVNLVCLEKAVSESEDHENE